MSDSLPGPWVLRPRLDPHPRCRLVLIPHAGGGPSAYRSWLTDLPAGLEAGLVALPGREGRLREAPVTSMADLVANLLPRLLPYLDRPFAVYGHSMGALVAFELVRALREVGGPMPIHLFAGAAPAPDHRAAGDELHRLPDLALLAAVQRRYGSIPPEIAADAELRALLLPALRADLTILETYTFAAGAPLACPISTFGGTDDPTVLPAELEAWRSHSTGRFVCRMVPGDHLFVRSARPFLISSIARDLAPWLTAGGP